MEDWQGNTINVGDELLIVTYKSLFGGQKMGLMMMDVEGNIEEVVKPTKTDNGFCWEISRQITVKPYGNTTSNDSVCINLLDPFALPNTMNQCLCIKGVSDNRELFMENLLTN